MSNAHKGSRLIQSGNIVPVDSNCVALFHYDITTNDVLNGVSPNVDISTFRGREGYYGGGVAVEDATTNIIPGGSVNMYPSSGNGWGSYQTNQYNNNQYFSIGTIISVSANVVTYSGGTVLRSYDVVRPSSNGGGLTAGTDYFVHALSNTQFTLHQYNNSQDGSQGFNVFNSITNDIRIQVSANGFPTNWWGAPHLPNSDTLKELRYKDFTSGKDAPHDYLRIYTNFRTDGVVGGIAYGVTPNVTSGNTYTISFYQRAVTQNSIGQTVNFKTYTGGEYWNNQGFTLTKDWQRVSFTKTPNNTGATYFYWFPPFNTVWDLSEIQIEQMSYPTSFTIGSRSAGVLRYPSTLLNPQSGTISCWIYVDPSGAHSSSTTWSMGYSIVQIVNSPSYAELNQISLRKYASSTEWKFVTSDNSGNNTLYSIGSPSKGWHMFTFTWGNGAGNAYLDGTLIMNVPNANLPLTFTNAYNNSLFVGSWTGSDYLNSIIDELRIDNVARTSEEILSWYISQRPFYPKGIYTVAY